MAIDLQSLYPRLLHLMLDTVFVVDQYDFIVFVSDACENLLGYRADELIGTPITGYIHPDDPQVTRVSIERIMSGQPHLDFRNRYVRKDGVSSTSCGQPSGRRRWARGSALRET